MFHEAKEKAYWDMADAVIAEGVSLSHGVMGVTPSKSTLLEAEPSVRGTSPAGGDKRLGTTPTPRRDYKEILRLYLVQTRKGLEKLYDDMEYYEAYLEEE